MSELDFFNKLSGKLKIELSAPAERIGSLLNEAAPPESRIVSVKLQPEIYLDEGDDFRELTPQEFDPVALRQPNVALRSESGDVVEHDAPNGQYFTVRELIAAVERTELETRDKTDWFGGVDVQHCYFEGIERDEDGFFNIYWGS